MSGGNEGRNKRNRNSRRAVSARETASVRVAAEILVQRALCLR